MKAKPVIPSSMEVPRTVNRVEAENFLQSGKADLKENPPVKAAPVIPKEVAPVTFSSPAESAPVARGKKLVELPQSLLEKIKDSAYFLSKQSGRRVTETQLIEKALVEYFTNLKI